MDNNYTFLPWLRQGISAEIPVPDKLGKDSPPLAPERAEVSVSFKVNGQPVSKQVRLLGPGDVVGINPRAVVKTEPRDWVTDFEANYLPYIEFYEEDFPWRFTPAKAANSLEQSRLRPWLFLIVLAEDEFEEKKVSEPLAAFEIKVEPGRFFPDKEQSWAWAHVHINQNVIGGQLQTGTEQEARVVEQNLANTLGINPDNASSRLLSPRKLQENTAYHAFVIPAFETGRLAGLGLDIPVDINEQPNIDGQKASWGAGQTLYPIYYRWFFRTGAKGDFEFLVDLLEPRPVDKRVGVRAMDMQNPGYEVDGMSIPLDVMGLEGALRSPKTESFPQQWPPENTDFEDPPAGSAGKFLNQLEGKVNLQFALQQEESLDNPHHPDPIISPPLYGKWYAMAEKLEVQNGTGWVNELNRDPRYRTPAGAGTQVIQKNQEKFMQRAWSQLGDLLQTNQKIRQMQLGWMSSYTIFRKNVLPQSSDQLLGFTQAVQARILGSATTIAQQVNDSPLPPALNPAFRKITRSRGVIMRKVAPDIKDRTRPVLTQLNAGTLTAAPPPPDPVGQISLDSMAEAIVPDWIPEWLRRWLRENIVRRVLIGLLVLAFVLLFVAGAFIVFAAIIAALGGLLLAAERLRVLIQTAEAFKEANLTPRSVDEIPARPDFVLTEFEVPLPESGVSGNADSVEAANFRVALKDAYNVYQSPPPLPPVRRPLDMNNAVAKLKQSLDPAVAIPKRAEFILKIPAKIKDSYLRPQKTLVTVMAHPVFSEPMYRPMRDISSELLVPNLHLIANNTVSLMETNQRFIEAYMVGLNHEMGSELLWREFPTDQRGSYFRQFWDVGDAVNRNPDKTAAQIEEELLDITKLHTWDRGTALGNHENRPLPDAGEARLVLVVRGDLLKKYPTTVIYAQQAMWSKDEDDERRDIRKLDDINPAETTIKEPIFKAEIEPDIYFLGFDLTTRIAKGNPVPAALDPGWFFVFQERPGEPRFGLDSKSDESPDKATKWNDLAWEHLENFDSLGFIDFNAEIQANIPDGSTDAKFQWGRNAADMAYILYQVPVMVAFHAADMLE